MSHIDDTTPVDLGVADYAEIVALWTRAGLPARPEGRDSIEAFARQMTGGRQRVIGLRDDERLIAVAVLTHDGRKGWINRLAVEPTRRRSGLATQLLAEAERWFTEDVGLDVWAALIHNENRASLALFEALGYQRPSVVYVSKRTRAEA